MLLECDYKLLAKELNRLEKVYGKLILLHFVPTLEVAFIERFYQTGFKVY